MDPNQHTPASHETPTFQPQGDMIPLAMPPEGMPAPQPQGPPAPIPAPATVTQSGTPAATPMPQTATPLPISPSAPAIADDLDLIEKEWVEKAKAIVAQTRHDPHAQNQEMNKFKADYMQKRYKKDIKVEP